MKLPWRRNKPNPEAVSTATATPAPEPESPYVVPFDGDIKDTATLKRHAVRALCALLMDRHDSCDSEHPFCGPDIHRRNGDTPRQLVAHPIPQQGPLGEDLLAIYLCMATGDTSEGILDPLEYTAGLACTARTPHRKVVVRLREDGSYTILSGPVLNPVASDHSTGALDRRDARHTISHPEPDYAGWEYYDPQLAKGPLRVIPELHCLQVFGEWWVVDVDRETGAYQQVAALTVGNNPGHEF